MNSNQPNQIQQHGMINTSLTPETLEASNSSGNQPATAEPVMSDLARAMMSKNDSISNPEANMNQEDQERAFKTESARQLHTKVQSEHTIVHKNVFESDQQLTAEKLVILRQQLQTLAPQIKATHQHHDIQANHVNVPVSQNDGSSGLNIFQLSAVQSMLDTARGIVSLKDARDWHNKQQVMAQAKQNKRGAAGYGEMKGQQKSEEIRIDQNHRGFDKGSQAA